MIPLLGIAMLVGAVAALSAYMQHHSAWWKGPGAVLGMLFAAFLLSLLASASAQPAAYGWISVALVLSGAAVGLGSVLALMVRGRISAGPLGGWTFVGVTAGLYIFFLAG